MKDYIELDRIQDNLASMIRAVDPEGSLEERAVWSALLHCYRKVSILKGE